MTRRYPKSQARRQKKIHDAAVALGKLGRGKTSKKKKETSAANAAKAREVLTAIRLGLRSASTS